MITVTVQTDRSQEVFSISPFMGSQTILKIRAWLMLMRAGRNPSDSSGNEDLVRALADNSVVLEQISERSRSLDRREAELIAREAELRKNALNVESYVEQKVAADFRKTIADLRSEIDRKDLRISELSAQIFELRRDPQRVIPPRTGAPVVDSFIREIAAPAPAPAAPAPAPAAPAPAPAAPAPAPAPAAPDLEID